MAARLLRRHGLKPPYDLDALVQHYAFVEHYHFPFDADGVTVGIGGETKPQILINSSAPDTRKRFTLAHELGHVFIPWHTGTIVSHLDTTEVDFEYREMEAEANRFAAELLIPSFWLFELEKSLFSIEEILKKVLGDSGVSRDAGLIKIFNTLNIPIICAQIDIHGYLIKDYRTNAAPSAATLHGKNLFNDKVFSTTTKEEVFNLGDRTYKSWLFDSDGIQEVDPRPWREVLNQILNETGREDLLGSINAVLPAKYNSNKNKSEQELCSLAIQAYDGRERFDAIVSHSLFPQYVVKRIKELMAKNKN